MPTLATAGWTPPTPPPDCGMFEFAWPRPARARCLAGAAPGAMRTLSRARVVPAELIVPAARRRRALRIAPPSGG